MDIIERKVSPSFFMKRLKTWWKTWNLLDISIFPDLFQMCQFSLTRSEISWIFLTLKILFFPDFYLTCGNHEQLNVECKRGLHCFLLFRSVIGPYNSYHPLNQSHAKRKPKATGSVSFYFFFGFAPLNPNSSNSNFYLEDKRILIVEEAGVVKICVTSFANRNNRAIL